MLRHAKLLGAAAIALAGFASAANADAAKPVIAMSNGYYGNTWRHQMVDSFEAVAKQAKADGVIGDYIIENGDGSVNQQIAQISDLILRKVDVIVMDASSENATDGIIKKACDAGIKVIAFDSPVTAPCAYKLFFDHGNMASDITDWMGKESGGKGNVLIVRGVKGSEPELSTYKGQTEALKKYPGMKVVAETFGMAAEASAQSAVSNILPSLPHIDVVLAAGGGDAYGIVQAFKQYGGDYVGHMPMIGGDNSGNFVAWWVAEQKANGYKTISINPPPGIGSAVLWVALAVAQGRDVPMSTTMPVLSITNDIIDKFADVKPGEIASLNFDKDWVERNVLAKK